MTLQISAAFAIFLFGLLGARMAQIAQLRSSSPWLNIGNCFAGGIFIGAGLIHTLPDSSAIFSELYPDTDFPFWAAIAACAILILMWIDQVLSQKATKSDVSGITLFIILSLHSIIAGVALGVEAHPLQAIAILIAILAHKSSAAFALGLRTLKPNYWRRMLAFSLMTPLGVVLGLILTTFLRQHSGQHFEAIFDAAAAGTFLYIALAEILPTELTKAASVHKAILIALLGLGLMAVLAVYT